MKYMNRALRHEIKCFISPYYYEILRGRLKSVLMPDKNSADDGSYRITSVYFDDIYRSAYNDKILGAKSRRKYRIRAYNLSPERITLEAKYKNDAFVSKVNALLSYDEYLSMIMGDYDFYYENEESRKNTSLEEFMVSNALLRPRPTVIVDYFREAYVSDAGNVRITFDKNLSTCYGTTDMFSPDALFSPVLGNEIILEIKYDDFLPVYIEEIMAGFPLTEESISKFILCTDKLTEVKKQCLL